MARSVAVIAESDSASASQHGADGGLKIPIGVSSGRWAKRGHLGAGG